MARKIIISKTAKKKIELLLEYLLENWNEKVKNDFIKKLDRSIQIIQNNPESFPQSEAKQGLYWCVLSKQTTLFYRFNDKKIFIITIFDNRQNPKKLNKEV